MGAKLISIIGPPACGKTTLAELLSQELPAGMIREDYAGNPFLADAYLGRASSRLPGQIYFLTSRVGQLSQARWPKEGLRVSDYGFCQDRIFARTQLDRAELELYEPLRDRLAALVHAPDLLILLEAAVEVLLERIARRGRDFEKVMTAEFLARMRRSYEQAAAEATCPVIRMTSDGIDLRRPGARLELLEQIRRLLSLPPGDVEGRTTSC